MPAAYVDQLVGGCASPMQNLKGPIINFECLHVIICRYTVLVINRDLLIILPFGEQSGPLTPCTPWIGCHIVIIIIANHGSRLSVGSVGLLVFDNTG